MRIFVQRIAALAAVLLCLRLSLHAQNEPAGIGPGTYIQLGATFSSYHLDYGQRQLGGASAFIDAHLYRRLGIEAEYKTLRLNEDEGVHDTTYLVGPRYSVFTGHLRPYAKFLVGRGTFYYPFGDAKGSYFVMAPGGGIDWHIARTRATVRVVDVEFQQWPGFSFGQLRQYGVSSGLAIRMR